MPALMNVLLGGTRRARSLTQLAEKLNMDADGLTRAVSAYNVMAHEGCDTQFGKQPDSLAPVQKGPFYAVNLSLKNKYGFSGSMPYGGLTVDENTGGVSRADGTVVDGLYAAGRTAVGICSGANFSGLSIADTIFSGRRAARAAIAGSDLDSNAIKEPKQAARA